MDNRQTPNLAIDGEIMKKYIKRMLGGEVGTAHVDIVYDIVKRAMLDERQFALRMCDYHLNRAGLKKEFADFFDGSKKFYRVWTNIFHNTKWITT